MKNRPHPSIPERLQALRLKMADFGYDIYLIPTDDYHQSEYVGEHFKSREYVTGFTGSAGTAVITMTEAGLWTDGRYFIQAEEQLKGSGITLYRMGEPNVPSIETYIEQTLPTGGTLGFDGRTLSLEQGLLYEELVTKKEGKLASYQDLTELIWDHRPEYSKEPAFLLSDQYAGESRACKLIRIRNAMKDFGATIHILTSLDDICWLMNLRGNDTAYAPLLLSYAIITETSVRLYVDQRKFSCKIQFELAKDNIVLRPYDSIYEDVSLLSKDCVDASAKDPVVLLDPAKTNYVLYQNLPKNIRIQKSMNPSVFMKAIKNHVEIQNIRNAHLKDGIAITKFMYWLKTNFERITITELSAAEKLEAFRKEQPGYLWQSFEPICGFASHGAIVHYSATKESDVVLESDNLFLTDTGGNYLEGSTDITRTFALGNPPLPMKEDFTTVLISHLRLQSAVFPQGTCGANLDILARMPLWKRGKDYNHGTGHGVGYLLNIHEAPCSLHTRLRGGATIPLEPGMLITDEPGIYVKGSHGIRTENILLVCEGEKTTYGEFLHFEPLTCAPVDLDAILPEMMTEEDKLLLNEYHAEVYKKIAPHLTEAERKWLKHYTREI